MNRKRALLAGLLLLLLLAIGYSISSSPKQKRVSPQDSPRSLRQVTPTGRTAPGSGGASGLRVDLLKPAERSYRGVQRDLFYGEAPKIEKPKPPPTPPPPPPVIAPPPVVVVPPPPIISVETRMALGRFIFLGYLEKNAIKTIFLGSGEEVFVVKKGERFGNKGEFLVVELTPTQMTVRDRDNPRLIVLPLVEKEALKPPSEEALRGREGTSEQSSSFPGAPIAPETPDDDQVAADPEVPPLEEPSPKKGDLMQTEGQTDGSDEE